MLIIRYGASDRGLEADLWRGRTYVVGVKEAALPRRVEDAAGPSVLPTSSRFLPSSFIRLRRSRINRNGHEAEGRIRKPEIGFPAGTPSAYGNHPRTGAQVVAHSLKSPKSDPETVSGLHNAQSVREERRQQPSADLPDPP